MTRIANKEGSVSLHEAGVSGLRRKYDADKPAGEILDAHNADELWELVDFWITQIVPGDSRRRLLELARLRHDARLAGAVLRFL